MCLRPKYLQNGTVVKCGKCIECRLQLTNDWVLRCKQELKLYTSACFVTLTYNDENLPPQASLRKADFQKFMKRLRKRFQPSAIRYFASCEYGSKTSRPHYHAILFGVDFADKWYFKTDKKGIKLYRSKTLEKLWKFGFSSIGEVNDTTIKYCTKYLTPLGKQYYQGREEPCLLMSRNPGIGMLNIPDSVFNDFSLYVDGKKIRAPKAYIRKVIENDYRMRERWQFINMSLAQREYFDLTHERVVEFRDGIEYSYWDDVLDKYTFFEFYDSAGSSTERYRVFDSQGDLDWHLRVEELSKIIEAERNEKIVRLEFRRKKYKSIFGKCIDKFFKPVYNFYKYKIKTMRKST